MKPADREAYRRPPWRMVTLGIYFNEKTKSSVFVAFEILQATGLEDTAENRALVAQTVAELMREAGLSAPIPWPSDQRN